MIVGHGDDRYHYGDLVRYDFSSNVPYHNHADAIIRHLSGRLDCLTHYPDPNARELRSLLAKRWSIDPNNILMTSGSTEAFYLLGHLFARGRTVITVPSFAEYEDACKLYQHQITYIPTTTINKYTESATLLWTALPNNPDGEIAHRTQILDYCSQHPNTYVVVDEAYAELSDQSVSLLDKRAKYPNLIIVRSLTKSFALPGIRLGYIVASTGLIQRLEPLRSPWSVNALALEAGRYICLHYDKLLPDARNLVSTAQQLTQDIDSLEGFSVSATHTHYFLVRLERRTAPELKSYLVHKYGVLIRDASNFRTLTPQHFRLSIQSPEACQELLRGLAQF